MPPLVDVIRRSLDNPSFLVGALIAFALTSLVWVPQQIAAVNTSTCRAITQGLDAGGILYSCAGSFLKMNVPSTGIAFFGIAMTAGGFLGVAGAWVWSNLQKSR